MQLFNILPPPHRQEVNGAMLIVGGVCVEWSNTWLVSASSDSANFTGAEPRQCSSKQRALNFELVLFRNKLVTADADFKRTKLVSFSRIVVAGGGQNVRLQCQN